MKILFTILVLLPVLSFAQCESWYYGTLRTEVRGDTVILKDDTAHRNCGAEYWMRVYQYSPDTITWIQHDTGTSIACMCTYNLSVTIDSLAPGHYFVKSYYNEPYYGILCFMGITEFDITKPNSNVWGTKIGDSQSECFTVGIKDDREEAAGEVTVYPNPACDQINVVTKKPGKKLIRIMDASSQCVFERYSAGEMNAIDVSSLPAGIYFISVVRENSVSNRKFCKL